MRLNTTSPVRAAARITAGTAALLTLACAGPSAPPRVAVKSSPPVTRVPVPTPQTVELPPSTVAVAPEVPTAEYSRPVVDRGRTRSVVLMYHAFGPYYSRGYQVSVERLDQQLQWLSRHVEVVPLSHFISFLEGKKKLPRRVAVITIDDGHVTTYTKAWPLLKRHGLPFTLALNTAFLEIGNEKLLTWNQINEMVDSGLCEVASHSVGHVDMIKFGDHRVNYELESSRRVLQKRVGKRPQAFVYPFGSHSGRIHMLTRRAGYRVAFGVGFNHSNPVPKRPNRWAIPRQAVNNAVPLKRFHTFFDVPVDAKSAP